MRILIFNIALLFYLLSPLSGNTQNFYEDHTIFNINKESSRSDFFAFENEQLATIGNPHLSGRFLSLNGFWKFKWVYNPSQKPENFQDPNFDDSDWDLFAVPANWEVHGYDYPIYLDEKYPFETHWPNVPRDYNPVGSYKKTIDIPDDWNDKDVFIHFGAVKSALYLWVNGEFVGYSQGSKPPAEFKLNDYLKEGENHIAFQVYRWSDASYVESQDMLRLSGVERDVYMYSRPKQHIIDFQVNAGLDESYKNGIFKLKVSLKSNSIQESKELQLKVSLFDKQNHFKKVAEFNEIIQLEENGEAEVNFEKILNNINA